MTVRRVAFILTLVVGAPVALVVGSPGAGAGDAGGDEPSILVTEISGSLDPVTADLIERAGREAERTRAALFVVTIDSPGSLDVDVESLLARLRDSRVPVVAWVEGGGSAEGAAALVLQAADVAAMATDATVGPALPVALDDPGGRLDVRARDYLDRLASEHGRDGASEALLTRRLGERAATAAGIVDVTAPTLRDLIAVLDGREVDVAGETRVLSLGEVVDGDTREKQVLPIRFRQLDLTDQLQHALTSPFVALLLLVTGLCLIVFEFFAIGIGLASLAGAGLVAASFVGLGHLPVNAVSLGMVIGGVVAISIDVQAGAPRFWAVVGSTLLVVGNFRFYAGSSRLDPAWWQVLLLVVAALVFLLPGLAALMRARFSSPTIGREWIVGEPGTAATALDPEGVVTVRDAPWRARATRAAGIALGDPVTVTAIHGLTLEVEPVEASDDGETLNSRGAS